MPFLKHCIYRGFRDVAARVVLFGQWEWWKCSNQHIYRKGREGRKGNKTSTQMTQIGLIYTDKAEIRAKRKK